MVTTRGTHVYCTAPTPADRDCWLAALHAGLEASFSNAVPELPPLVPPSPKRLRHANYCKSCGTILDSNLQQSTPLPHYGMEQACQVCPECCVAQGVLMDVQRLSNLYRMQDYQSSMLAKARDTCSKWLEQEQDDNDDESLLDLIESASFGTFRRSCPQVEQYSALLVSQTISPAEFLEGLGQASGTPSLVGELKKEAFRVAGDMGSAMKLLQDHSLKDDTDMLSYILEFFLDLCEEGELSSVAFFWPQLQCIHLRMLPPQDAQELARVELMEDFLMTVSIQYSVQLGLELVWGHTADLEESLYNTNCSPNCRGRRFSVLRFVCELESLLFDFEHGWGGGSVSLRNMLKASPHQITLLRLAMTQLQECRQRIGLSRSVRRDKLNHTKFSLPPEQAAQEALRIARNADYYSSHLSFIRRLGDVAERLRFMEVEMRAPTLERELTLLNSSGGMGGDPLNRVQENLIRVVRVPRTEGHVFRSKERTPVLLLMEVVEEGVEDESDLDNDSSYGRDQHDKDLIKALIEEEALEASPEKAPESVKTESPSDNVAEELEESEDKEASGNDTDEAESTDESMAETEEKSDDEVSPEKEASPKVEAQPENGAEPKDPQDEKRQENGAHSEDTQAEEKLKDAEQLEDVQDEEKLEDGAPTGDAKDEKTSENETQVEDAKDEEKPEDAAYPECAIVEETQDSTEDRDIYPVPSTPQRDPASSTPPHHSPRGKIS